MLAQSTVSGLLAALLFAGSAQAATSFNLGDKALGGTVFYVTQDGSHGLVAANKDQGKNNLYKRTEYCSEDARFDEDGQVYTDWKLPSRYQLKKMYEQRDLIGGFRSAIYWSSYPSYGAYINFKNGKIEGQGRGGMNKSAWVRCIRVF